MRYSVVIVASSRAEGTMCIGCAEAVLMTNDGKAPDTSETAIWMAGFAVWILLLTHIARKNTSKSSAC